MFARLLIANRGEIAIRIARAAAEAGLPTVAVYAADDADSLHVAKADAAVPLPGSGVPAYCDRDQLLLAAERSGADAIHPGYGFLSEDAEFARACARRGITFVGPAPETLAAFGDKISARRLAREAGLPVLAGTDGPVDEAGAAAFQRSFGAVMLKAVAGGGGRGMRRVDDPAELAQAYRRCASEARAAFGSALVYVEELFTPARHIEVQIVGDGTGAVVQLGDRDCSVQRRNQKILEIAPSPGLPGALRERLLTAAVRLAERVGYRGVGTVEFLVDTETQRFAFIEVNPRLQVEHTVTEEVTGVDLVGVALRLAAGASLAEVGLSEPPAVLGSALQARINLETMHPDGTTTPSSGVLTALELPAGRGIRVDATGYPGYRVGLRYDSLLAKLVVHNRGGRFTALTEQAYRAVCECRVAGVQSNLDVLAGVLAHPDFTPARLSTTFLDTRHTEVLAAGANRPRRYQDSEPARDLERTENRALDEPIPDGALGVRAASAGTVVAVDVAEGEVVRAGQQLLVLEAMKMEHVIAAPAPGRVRTVLAELGATVAGDELLALLEPAEASKDNELVTERVDPDHRRPDLTEILERHALGLDDRRAGAVAKRHRTGLRTARENLEQLCDPGSFVEYGPLAIAAQRRRRPLDELIERTPADGLVGGTATVNAELFGTERAGAIVMSYDYTVLAGTQGLAGHKKKDRLFELAQRRRLPVVVYAEGGGGRPGDTDGSWVSMLDVPAFYLFGRLSGLVPLVGIAAGRCFAGNAALLGCCDVVIAVRGASIGMGGPAMIEGGGLGVVHPDDVGPAQLQTTNGVVDVLVDDEAEATDVARRYLSYFQGAFTDWRAPDQRELRHVVPQNRVRVYDMRRVASGLADTGSVLELRREFGTGMITALVRVEGRPMGLIANNPAHLGGAIDHDGADKAARFLQLCDAFGLPVLSLCDTPGFMVGPDSERHATVRHFSRLFVIGANLSVPIGMVIVRKSYGLGAQAMGGGSLKVPTFTVAWPTGEFGGMGLEGAVRLGYRKELAAVEDPEERQRLFEKMVAAEYQRGKAANTATVFEIDDVIDPADTRRWITSAFAELPVGPRPTKTRPCIDTW